MDPATQEYQPKISRTSKGEKIVDRRRYDDDEDLINDRDSDYTTCSSGSADTEFEMLEHDGNIEKDPSSGDFVIIHPDLVEGFCEHVDRHPVWSDLGNTWLPVHDDRLRLRGCVLDSESHPEFSNLEEEELLVEWMHPEPMGIPSSTIRPVPKSFLLVADRAMEEGDIVTHRYPQHHHHPGASSSGFNPSIGIVSNTETMIEVQELPQYATKIAQLLSSTNDTSSSSSMAVTDDGATTSMSKRKRRKAKTELGEVVTVQPDDEKRRTGEEIGSPSGIIKKRTKIGLFLDDPEEFEELLHRAIDIYDGSISSTKRKYLALLRRKEERKKKLAQHRETVDLDCIPANRVVSVLLFRKGDAVIHLEPCSDAKKNKEEEGSQKTKSKNDNDDVTAVVDECDVATTENQKEEKEIKSQEGQTPNSGHEAVIDGTDFRQRSLVYWVEAVFYLHFLYFPQDDSICIVPDKNFHSMPTVGVFQIDASQVDLEKGTRWIRGDKGNNKKKNGTMCVSIFWVPYLVTVLDHDDKEIQFDPCELKILEASYSAANRVGKYAFLVTDNDLMAGGTPEDDQQKISLSRPPKRCKECTMDHSKNRKTTKNLWPSAMAFNSWYHQIFPPKINAAKNDEEEEQREWNTYLLKLIPFLKKLVRISASRTVLTVKWRNGTIKNHYAAGVFPTERPFNDEFQVEIMPADIVYPSCPHLIQIPKGAEEQQEEGDIASRSLEMVSSIMDFKPFFEDQCDVVVHDQVIPRQKADTFMSGDVELADPEYLGYVMDCSKMKTEQQCTIRWVRQPKESIRKPLRSTTHHADDDDDEGLAEEIGNLQREELEKQEEELEKKKKKRKEEQEDAQIIGNQDGKEGDVENRHAGKAGWEVVDKFGFVIEILPDTRLLVEWSDGSVEHCWRHNISVYRQIDADGLVSEEDDDVHQDEQPDSYTWPHGAVTADTTNSGGETQSKNWPTRVAQSVSHAVTSALSSLWSKKSTTMDNHETEEGNDLEEDQPSVSLAEIDATILDKSSSTAKEEEEEETKKEKTSTLMSKLAAEVDILEAHLLSPGPSFTICATFSRHKYLHEKWNAAQPVKFTNRIQKEWAILRTHLPPNIYAKAAEDTLHLMKFAIVGPAHSPYYQSFLCFDLQLSQDYPQSAPHVHFISKGYKMNPNLYENGHICLSLLGTWEGKHSSESWSAADSNLLQVILSIQALVLVKEPYYNEAGYMEQVGTAHGRSESKIYNEQAYIMRLQHTFDSAEHHPADWTYEYREHYQRYVPLVLQRAKDLIASSSSLSAGKKEDGVGDPMEKPAATTTTTSLRSKREESECKEGKAKANVENGLTEINLDGLIAPFSVGFLKAVESRVQMLETQYNTLVPKWKAEEEAYSLPHFNST